MKKIQKIMTSLMLFFTIAGVIAQPVNAFASETGDSTAVSAEETKSSEDEAAVSTTSSEATMESTVSSETAVPEVAENTSAAKEVEVGESQNANDSPLENPLKVEDTISTLPEEKAVETTDGSATDTNAVSSVYVGAMGVLMVDGKPVYYADGTTPVEYDKLLQQGTAIQLRSSGGAQITYSGPITYSYWTVGQFQINGKVAFCIEHEKGSPATDTPNSGTSPYDNETIASILYYGWGGAGNVFASSDGARGIVITSLALSNAYTGGDKGTADEAYQVLMNKVVTAPIKDTHVSLNGTNLTVHFTTKISGSKQVSSQGSFSGKGASDYISFKVPAGMTYVCENTGATSTNADVKVYSGQKFHFEASLNANASLSTGTLKNFVQDFQPLLVKPMDGNLQTLATWQWYTDPTDVVSFDVSFKPIVGNVSIKKVDDLGNPVAGVKFQYTSTDPNYPSGEWVTGTDVKWISNGWTPGTKISVTEVSAPEGYKVDTTPQTWTVVAGETHEFDFVNPKQTIGTTATDAADGDKTLVPEKKVTIVDAVAYKNLYTDGRE